MSVLISKNFNSKISQLIEKGIFSSKEEAIEVACALGLIYNEKKTVKDTIALEFDSFDENKIFAVIASARNSKLTNKSDVIAELEKYIEAGNIRLNEKFDFYEVYDKIKKLELKLF
jgi:Arc/MetJ-type ribon-helix-helix transcriptional regulator